MSTWIPTSERLPTREDANKAGEVLAVDARGHQWLWNFSKYPVDMFGLPPVAWVPTPPCTPPKPSPTDNEGEGTVSGQFWVVWAENGGTPVVQHPTETSATHEAERLARQPDRIPRRKRGRVNAKPIIFSAPMVRALLDGRKTQTRRIVKWPVWANADDTGQQAALIRDKALALYRDGRPIKMLRCPYGQPGDYLWVRETWAHYHTVNHVRQTDGRAFDEVSDGLVGYRADGHDTIEDFRKHVQLTSERDLEAVEINGDRWRPSIHMPRWASRITLKIYDVRVERLNAISEADARAEGAAFHDGRGIGHSGWRHDNQDGYVHGDARSSFARLWNGLHGPDSWTANPYVWAISFDVIRANLTEAQKERAA